MCMYVVEERTTADGLTAGACAVIFMYSSFFSLLYTRRMYVHVFAPCRRRLCCARCHCACNPYLPRLIGPYRACIREEEEAERQAKAVRRSPVGAIANRSVAQGHHPNNHPVTYATRTSPPVLIRPAVEVRQQDTNPSGRTERQASCRVPSPSRALLLE
ncbi:hypothetical protein BC567DRAFT_233266 [Phyllosticta citribraziliensis]